MSSASKIQKSLTTLNQQLKREGITKTFSFEHFLEEVAANPLRSLRNIFQLFHDMIHFYIPPGHNEYPNDPESINYIFYDCSKLFIEESDNPFLADRLLANRLVSVVDSLKEGVVRNRMLVFVGPPGSGKSTFLNNLLAKLEKYTLLDEGAMYETVWQIEVEKLGMSYIPDIITSSKINENGYPKEDTVPKMDDMMYRFTDKYLIIPCPSHDHPIIQVPKEYREHLLDQIIDDKEQKKKLFHHKEYEWILKSSPCAVCSSIYKALHERLPDENILNMVHTKRYEFSRILGDGVSVYNPGDKVFKTPLHNPELQKWINAIFKSSSAVNYTYSRLAKTNNGIFVIMDVKMSNIDRIKNIHGIISDGIHKVGTFEESIHSLFMTLINPEDIKVINEQKSFQDRVIRIPIPYIRDYNTEVEIYKNIFGGGIVEHFLPRILKCFARTIVSTRLNKDSSAMKQWILNPKQYEKYCDKYLLLLKMEIYTGLIPVWLTEEDVKRLDRKIRRKIIMEGDSEGNTGLSGRESLELFNHFYTRFRNRDDLINMENLLEFFSQQDLKNRIPDTFLEALESLYDFSVLQEVKEAMFYYNKTRISHDIQNYLFAINHDYGNQVECPYTKDKINISESYFILIENRLLNKKTVRSERENFRNDVLRHYVAKTLHEVNAGKSITTTKQYKNLVERYNHSLKENVLSPFVNNDNFRRAIKDFGTTAFKNYDKRIREEVNLLMKNLKFKFDYSEKGAKQICIYVIDKNLVKKFTK